MNFRNGLLVCAVILLTPCAAAAYTSAWPEEAQTLPPRGFSALASFESDERSGQVETIKPLSGELRAGVAPGLELQIEKTFAFHDFGGTQFDYWEKSGTTAGPKILLRQGQGYAFSAMPYATFGDSRRCEPSGGRYGGILFISRTLQAVTVDFDVKAEASSTNSLYSYYGGARTPVWGADLEGFLNLRGDYATGTRGFNEAQLGLRLNYFEPVRAAFRYDFQLDDMRLDNDWVAAINYVSRF